MTVLFTNFFNIIIILIIIIIVIIIIIINIILIFLLPTYLLLGGKVTKSTIFQRSKAKFGQHYFS